MDANVALRKESVDRNRVCAEYITDKKQSLSARRAWIEIACQGPALRGVHVALRKESVDRNNLGFRVARHSKGRSPQGERG